LAARAIASIDPAGDFQGKSAERGPPVWAGKLAVMWCDMSGVPPRGNQGRQAARAIARPPARAGDFDSLRKALIGEGLGRDNAEYREVRRHPAVWRCASLG
jgi:hypothetical protein